MKAKSPEHGVAFGCGDPAVATGLEQGAGVAGAYVMSNARSSPGGFWLPWDLSLYLHPSG
ncbi:MAG: hypothetical protein ACYDB4_07635 [Candidatus Dormibacteraceae bacterium]